MTTEPTCTEALLSLGMTHRPSKVHGKQDVIDAVGRVVFTGDGAQAWRWLRETGMWP